LTQNVVGKSPQEYGRNRTRSFLIEEEKERSRRGGVRNNRLSGFLALPTNF
jgi:hypothetical protein